MSTHILGQNPRGGNTANAVEEGLIGAADPALYPYTLHFAKNLHHPVHLVIKRP